MQRRYGIQAIGDVPNPVRNPAMMATYQTTAACSPRTKVYVTHIDFQAKDLKIWAQFDLNVGKQLEMRLATLERSQAAVPLSLDRAALNIGSKVVAKFDDGSNQTKLYRAMVMKIHDNGKVMVHYMDYGNEAEVDINEIYDSNIPVFDWEPLAKECTIDGVVAAIDQWDFEAVAFVQQNVCYEDVEIEVLAKQLTKYRVQVYFGPNRCKLSDFLVSKGWAVPHPPLMAIQPVQPIHSVMPPAISAPRLVSQQPHPYPPMGVALKPPAGFAPVPVAMPHHVQAQPYAPIPVKPQPVVQQTPVTSATYKQRILKRRTKEFCVISYINDLEDFYVHLTSYDSDLGDLQEALQQYGNARPAPATTLFKDMPCISLFRDDNMWYRSIIKEVQAAFVKVQYVDYGNEAVVQKPDVLPMPQHFMMKEAMAIKCALYGLPQQGIWSPDEVEIFHQVIEDHGNNTHFILLVQEVLDDSHLVELFTPDRINMNSLLKERLDAFHHQQRIDAIPPPAQYQQGPAIQQPQSVMGDHIRVPVKEVPVSPEVVTKVADGSSVRKDLKYIGGQVSKMNRMVDYRNVEFARRAASGNFIFYDSSLAQGNSVDATKVVVSGFPPLVIPAKADDFVDVIVSYVDTTGNFYVQLKQNEADIEKLSQKLNTLYASGTVQSPVLANPSRGQICAAKYSVDQRWYRGLILERLSPTQLKVFFVDYGNTEKMSKADVKELRPDCTQLPAQAVECKLEGISFGSDPQLIEKFRQAAEAQEMVVRFVDKDGPSIVVTLFKVVGNDKDYDINAYLLGRGPAPPSVAAAMAAPTQAEPAQAESKTGFNDFGGSRSGRRNDDGGFGNRRSDEDSQGGFGGGGRGGGFGGRGGGRFGDRQPRGDNEGGGFGGQRFGDDRGGGRGGRFGGDRGGRGGFGDREGRGGFGGDREGRGGFGGDREGRGGFGGDRGGGRFGGDRGGRGGRFNDRGGRGGGRFERGGSRGGGFGGGFNEQGSSGGFGGGFGEASNGGGFGGFGTDNTTPATDDWSTPKPAPAAESWDTAPDLKKQDEYATTYPQSPKVSGTFDVDFAFVEELPLFYAIKKTDAQKLSVISEDLRQAFDKLDAVDKPQIGDICCAMFDDQPYRAKVIKVKETSSEVEILYVDYGNKETKKYADVKKLPKKFAELYPVAIASTLDGVTDAEKAAEATEKFEELLENGDLKLKIKSFDDQKACYAVNLVVSGETGDVAVALGLKEKSDEVEDEVVGEKASEAKEQDEYATTYPQSPKVSGTFDVDFAFVEELPLFYAIKKTDAQQLSELSEDLRRAFDKLDAVDKPQIGDICCAMFDDQPYRAKVIEVKETSSEVEILYVDYGNKETKKYADVKKLPKKFAELYPVAIASTLDGVTDAEKAAEATEKFEELLENGDLKLKIKSFDDQKACYAVNLVVSGETGDVAVALGLKEKSDEVEDEVMDEKGVVEETEDVAQSQSSSDEPKVDDAADDIKNDGSEVAADATEPPQVAVMQDIKLTQRRPLIADENISGCVTNVENFDKFWLSLADTSGFDVIQPLLSDYCKQAGGCAVMTDVEIGNVCIVTAEIPEVPGEDPKYFRGQVVGIGENGDSCDILLIDYGYRVLSYPTTSVFVIPPPFVGGFPAQAIKCSLYDADPTWLEDKQMLEKFSDLVKGKSVIAVVKSAKENSASAEVELKLDGTDVRQMLIDATDKTVPAQDIEDELDGPEEETKDDDAAIAKDSKEEAGEGSGEE